MRNARAARRTVAEIVYRSRANHARARFSRAISPPLIAYFASVSDFHAQRPATITESVVSHRNHALLSGNRFRARTVCASTVRVRVALLLSRIFMWRNLSSLVSRYDVLNGESKWRLLLLHLLKEYAL